MTGSSRRVASVKLVFAFLAGVVVGVSAVALVGRKPDGQAEVATTTALTAPMSPASSGTSPPTSTTIAPPADLPVVFVSPDGSDLLGDGLTVETAVRSLQFAIGLADQGDTVIVAEGDYGPFDVSGRSDLTIEVASGAVATIMGNGYERQTGILIRESTGITISGLNVTSVLRGIRVEASSDVVLDAVHVFDIGQEAVAFTTLSTGMTLRDSLIEMTGRRPGDNGDLPYSAFGEGVYLGTGGQLPDGSPDVVSDVLIENNEISGTTAEAIDVKASVEQVVIRSNFIHDVIVDSGAAITVGRGTRNYSADVLIENNVIWNVETSGPFTDGNGILVASTGVIRNNAVFDVQHRGILIDDDLRSASSSGLLVEGNWISNALLVAIEDRSLSTGVPVTVDQRSQQESEALRSEFSSSDGYLDGFRLLERLRCLSADVC